MQVCGGSQSFNVINQLRVLGRWMRIPHQNDLCPLLGASDAGSTPYRAFLHESPCEFDGVNVCWGYDFHRLHWGVTLPKRHQGFSLGFKGFEGSGKER